MTDDVQAIGYWILVCFAAYLALLWLLRRDGVSFGLPFAYLSLLLLNHVPGAFVQLVDEQFYLHTHEIEIGIRLAAIGAICFVVGVWLARLNAGGERASPAHATRTARFDEDKPYWMFCVLGGWLFTFGLTPLRNLPSIGAVIYNGGAIWMLGVVLGLRAAVRKSDWTSILIWLGLLAVYPAMILVTAGFISYGADAAIVVVSVLAVSARRYWRAVLMIVLSTYMGLSVFSNYFQARDDIRNVVWRGASMSRRIDQISRIVTDSHPFNTNDQLVLLGLDLRLNQNYFVGLAAENIDNGTVHYLYGRSITDALLSVIPRAIWPNKTVYGGSPAIVSEMTGLNLSTETSFGVGNVMEFYINYGVPGLIAGFLSLGWLLGRFDQRAARAEARRDYGTTMLYFLPGVALIQPIGSMVELTGSAVSAWLAAYFWKWAWATWHNRQASHPIEPPGAMAS